MLFKLYRGAKQFNKSFQAVINLAGDLKNKLLADSLSVVNGWKTKIHYECIYRGLIKLGGLIFLKFY
jgi:hypothetical protein